MGLSFAETSSAQRCINNAMFFFGYCIVWDSVRVLTGIQSFNCFVISCYIGGVVGGGRGGVKNVVLGITREPALHRG
jgi:hypothetical protein